jgi:hypothetical protein
MAHGRGTVAGEISVLDAACEQQLINQVVIEAIVTLAARAPRLAAERLERGVKATHMFGLAKVAKNGSGQVGPGEVVQANGASNCRRRLRAASRGTAGMPWDEKPPPLATPMANAAEPKRRLMMLSVTSTL